MIGDKKGNAPKGALRLSLLACAIAFASNSLAQDDAAVPPQFEQGSNFLKSLRSAAEDQRADIEERDVTRDYLERTVEKPKLDTEIPSQDFRDEGPRISVRKFQFHRLAEYPEYGITKEKIEELAEELRSKYMKEDEMFASGYTRDNLEELAAYLDKIGAQKDPREMGIDELRGLISIIEQQNALRGISYADLEEITSEITAYYRRQGLFLAQVQIPAQDVEDGVVLLTVQEGLLGQVLVEDNKGYSENRLKKPFEKQLGDLVSHKKVEEGMYLLNDLPGLNVTGYFTAGENPGETALNLKVREEKKWRLALKADNHGSKFSGNYRALTTLDLLNPFGIGDQLNIGALKSFSPGNSKLGQFSYNFPFFSNRTRMALSYDKNVFKLSDDGGIGSINGLGIEGESESTNIKLDHKFRRSRDFNFSGNFGISQQSSITETGESFENDVEGVDSNEKVNSASAGFYIDSLGEKIRMLNLANIQFEYGKHQNEVKENRGETFSKFEIDTNSLVFIPLPFTDAQSRLILKSRGLYSEQSLPSFEQMSLGGVSGVRSFTSREISVDQAIILSAEWYFDLPGRLNDYLQLALIADGAYGVATSFDEGDEDTWAHLSGAGMLFKLNWNDAAASQISIATPTGLTSNQDGLGDEQDDIQVFADFTVFFK